MSGVRDSRNPSDYWVLTHSDNRRRICGSLLLAKILQSEASHIPIKPQSAGGNEEMEEKYFKERARK